MRRLAALLVIALASVAYSPAPAAGDNTPPPLRDVHAADGRFVDARGRTVILRGANAIDKWRQDDPDLAPDLTEDELQEISAIGFNHLRLGTQWSAIEPQPGEYDEAAIDALLDDLDRIRDAGLFAVVDMHQDVWSAGIGSDGAPGWADPQCNTPPSVPLASTTGRWWAQYFSPDVFSAWVNFWNDGFGEADPLCTGPIQTRFIAMWSHLAARLGRHPAVIGYDLLNEPFPGSPPGQFELTQLYPFYQRLAAAIHDEDPDATIFFEPSISHSAMVSPPIPYAPADNAAYAPHLYTETTYSGTEVSTDGRTDEAVLLHDNAEAERVGVPLWVGEWGAFENDASTAYQREVYALLDELQASSAYWCWKQSRDGAGCLSGQPRQQQTGHVRVYPEAFPGDATWSYDPDAHRFSMRVTVEEPGKHEVRLVVPAQLGLDLDLPNVTAYRSAHRAVWTIGSPGTHVLELSE